MSKFQTAYNQANKSVQRVMVPEIEDEIKELKDSKRSLTNNDMKKAVDAKIKALEIKKKSIRAGDPVKEANFDEESAAAITTTSVGDAAVVGGQANFAPHMGMVSRRGDIKPPKKCKRKKKKTQKEFVEHYFEINE